MPAEAGTTCGDGKVCSAVGTCEVCAAGETCKPTDLCKTGKIECKTGAPVCAPSADAPNGSECGEGQVCSAGACVACRDGMSCVPTNKCHNGSLSCSTGTAQCMDLGTNLANGAVCGEGQVCRDGECAACVEKMPCVPTDNPCKIGEIRCASGTPVCMATAMNAPEGKECGAELACRGGMCRQCRTSGSCSTNPCKDSTYQCTAGVESCRETNKANGTLCPGGENACLDGRCARCRNGGECDDNPCSTSSFQCNGGRESCQRTGNVRDGTRACGNDRACRGGSCQACRFSGECTPDENNDARCRVGMRQCDGNGVEQCIATARTRSPGDDCGGGRVCARKSDEDRALTCRGRLPDSASSSCQTGRERTRECQSNYCNDNGQCDQCGRDPFECCPDGANGGCDNNHFCEPDARNCVPKAAAGEPCERAAQCRSGRCDFPLVPNGVCSNERTTQCNPGRSNGSCPPDPVNPPTCVDVRDTAGERVCE